MVQNLPQKVKDHSVGQGILLLLRNLPLHITLSQFSLVHNFTSYFSKINFNLILPSVSRSPKWSLYLRFSYQNSVCIYCVPVSATCPAIVTILDLITMTVLCEK